MMQRMIYKQLINWKHSKSRMPLLLRGARQIGKTFITELFATNEFNDHLQVNFELYPEYISCFKTLDPKIILQRLEFISGKKITPGSTLLFLDEIQEYPQAIEALRYFKEQCPELHVIGAGSLLEFALNEENFRMPVGRVEFLYMYPLTFAEFLSALGHDQLLEHLNSANIKAAVDEVAHTKLLELLKLYFITGGMPAVIQTYLQEKSLQRCQHIQAFLLNTFRNDFGKYAGNVSQQHCRRVFDKAPFLVAKHFRYVDVDPEIQSRSLKLATHLLIQAGLILPVYETKANSIQLNAAINEKKFKLLFLDVGLVKYASKLNAEILTQEDLLLLNHGAMAEQFVGQELIAHQPNFREAELYFWQRAQRNDAAEIDYVILSNNQIVPIEVKAGKTGRLKSLHSFMQQKQCPIGIKISQSPLEYKDKILSLPLYMISQLDRLISELLAAK